MNHLVDPEKLLSMVDELSPEEWARYPSLEPEIIRNNLKGIFEKYGQ